MKQKQYNAILIKIHMSRAIEKIRNYLKKNNFYYYAINEANLSKLLLEEYDEIAQFNNPRNIFFEKTWKDVKTFHCNNKITIIELGSNYLKFFEGRVMYDQKISISKKQTIEYFDNKISNFELFLAELKKQLDTFTKEEEREKIVNGIFICGFPLKQIRKENGLYEAVINNVSKGFTGDQFIDKNIGEELEKFLHSNGYPNIQFSVTNDSTVCSLASKTIEVQQKMHFELVINIFIGSRANISVGYDTQHGEQKGFYLVNTEFGHFKSIPPSKFDTILIENPYNPQQFILEKMISGYWHSRLFKVMLTEMVKSHVLPFESIDNFDFDIMESEEIEKTLASNILEPQFKILFEFIWNEILTRAANICAILIANIMIETHKALGEPVLNVGIVAVGGVIEKAMNFKKPFVEKVENELTKQKYNNKLKYHFLNPKHVIPSGAIVFDLLTRKNVELPEKKPRMKRKSIYRRTAKIKVKV